MAGSIGPLVKAAPRTWMSSISLYVLGNLIGLAMLGMVAGTAGRLLFQIVGYSALVWLIVGALGVCYSLRELKLLPIDLPLPNRLETTYRWWWTSLGPNRASLLWGLQLGFAVTTVVPYASFYFLVICSFVIGDPVLGVKVMGTYGLARALPTIAAAIPIAWGVPPLAVSEWPMKREAIFQHANAVALLAASILLAWVHA